MKKSIFRMLFSLIVIALIAGCSDDDSTNPDNSGNLGNLVGTWNATEFTYTSNANPSDQYDFLSTGVSVVFKVESDGDYTVTIGVPGFPAQSFSGNLNADSNGDIEIDDDPDIQVTVTSTTLTIVDPNESWDFDEDGTDEPATLRQVYTKQ
ncbi:MAG: hypothetical protein KDH95_21335 [Calditrichaeota bacterium]|nr:hypothetical protein [Calditrichota bacterium]MCB0270715.1 hypothetical protein [Calditrichota bacterium]